MTKDEWRHRAIILRNAGHSYSFIRNKIPVSRGTLSDWLSNIPFTPNKETLLKINKARIKSGEIKRQRKLDSLKDAHQEALKDIGNLKQRDIFMLGVGLYLGEGTKTGDDIRIINSNSKIIRFAIRWFRESCNVPDENFRIRLHLYPDSNEKECLKFWSKETNIPISRFYKTQVDLRNNKKLSKRAKLPYGTAHLSVRSKGKRELGVFLARRIRSWMEIVLR